MINVHAAYHDETLLSNSKSPRSETVVIYRALRSQLRPQGIWSMDEVGFSLADGGDYRIIAHKGSKRINLLVSVDRFDTTVVFFANAGGYCLESYFILKGSSQVGSLLEHYKLAGFYKSLVLGANRGRVHNR